VSHPGHHARERPDRPALIQAHDGAILSWRGLHERAVAAANRLHDQGLRPGSSLAICLENRFEFAVFVWAAQYAGYRYTPISTRLGAAEVEYILADCGAEAVVVSNRTDTAKGVAGDLSPAPKLLDVDAEDFLRDAPNEAPRYVRSEGVGMLYSSGTTGKPKGVRQPVPSEPVETLPPGDRAVGALLGFDTDAIYLSTAPLYHAAPLNFLVRMGRFGASTVVMDRFDPVESLALIERHRVTHSQWVPTMFVRLLRLDEAERTSRDLSSHRMAIHGAAPCPIPLKSAMLDWWGPILYEYYAGTEGAGTCLIGPTEWLEHKGSVGRSAGGRVHILDENGGPVPVGEIGEIWFEGSAHFAYHNDADKTSTARKSDGRASFGDVGYVDADGYLYLTDRKAFTINVGGVNVYPQEAEDVLAMHPKVADAAVFGIPHPEYGEEVKAVVELRGGVEADARVAQDLIDHCTKHLAKFKCPRSIDFEATLPREATGKLYKRLLRDRYLGAE
jgi:long-chain acyl-CoA synthetase